MPAAYVGAAASVFGAMNASDAASSAADAQSQSAQAQLALQQKMYNQAQAALYPYVQSGQAANTKLSELLGTSSGINLPTNSALGSDSNWNDLWNANVSNGMGFGSPDQVEALRQKTAQDYQAKYGTLPAGATDPTKASDYGSLLKTFSASDLNANLAPNYAFMLDQGQQANKNAANASGGLLGGNALQGLNTFTQNYAQNAYQQAYNNYNTNQNNIYTRLSGVANQGQAAASGTASNALAGAAQQSGSLASLGQSQASGIVGSANALNSGLNNAASYYQLGQIMNGSGNNLNNYGGPGMGGYATGMQDIYNQLYPSS